MKIDGIGFNQEWAWAHTEDQFVNEFKGMAHIFQESADKVAKLKEAYGLLQQGKPKDYVAPKGPIVTASNDLVKENVHLLDETGSKGGSTATAPVGKTAETGKTS